MSNEYRPIYVCVCPRCTTPFIGMKPFERVPVHTYDNAECGGLIVERNETFNLKALMDMILFGVSSRYQKRDNAYLYPER